MSDHEIIENVRQNNSVAYQHIYKNKTLVMGMVRKRGGTVEEAEDIFHNSLIAFLDKIRDENFVLTSRLRAFLCGIVHNMWKKQYEERKKFAYNVKDNVFITSKVFDGENLNVLNSCLDELNERDRAILEMVYFEYKSMEEIAAELNYTTTDSAKNQKCRAMRKLEKIVKEKYNRDDFFYMN